MQINAAAGAGCPLVYLMGFKDVWQSRASSVVNMSGQLQLARYASWNGAFDLQQSSAKQPLPVMGCHTDSHSLLLH
jgi:hypothetical protein